MTGKELIGKAKEFEFLTQFLEFTFRHFTVFRFGSMQDLSKNSRKVVLRISGSLKSLQEGKVFDVYRVSKCNAFYFHSCNTF